MHVVYTITHPYTGVFYIGYTHDLVMRKASHVHKLRNNIHPSELLQAAWNIEPRLTWSFVECDDRDHAVKLEKETIVSFKGNDLLANYRFVKGFEQWQKESVSRHMKAYWTDERKKIRGEERKGRKHTEATLTKMKKVHANNKLPAEANVLAAEKRRIQISIDGVVYRTAKIAAAETGWNINTVLKRARSTDPQWESWKIVDKE